jgi:hypothetical protein
MLTIGLGRTGTPKRIVDVAAVAAAHFGVELRAHAAYAA